MAQFYNHVVFKQYEAMQMFEKAKLAFQVNKLSRINQERQGTGDVNRYGSSSADDQEKGLLMAHINLKRPMKITFINKAALKMTQYSMSEALLLSINSLMPKDIAESH